MLVAGVDEAGRGPLAGPVVAAAVVFDADYKNSDFKDSKILSKRRREFLFAEIKNSAKDWAIVAVGHRRIEQINILQASRLAMALATSRVECDLVLVDGNVRIATDRPQETIIGGDRLHVAISAASILAKVWRDNLMCKLAEKYPHYQLEKHAGYPTSAHRELIKQFGPSPIHRRTFRGVKEFVVW